MTKNDIIESIKLLKCSYNTTLDQLNNRQTKISILIHPIKYIGRRVAIVSVIGVIKDLENILNGKWCRN